MVVVHFTAMAGREPQHDVVPRADLERAGSLATA